MSAAPGPASAPGGLVVVGLSHRTAPIEVRERYALRGRELTAWIDDLASDPGVGECVVLSTCNRTECYAVGPEPERLAGLVGQRLRAAAGLPPEDGGYLRSLEGFEAVRHLFRVAGGLDSLVIGEHQIQGQVSGAYHAEEGPLLGPVLHRLFQSALAAGGRIRSGTGIARGAASIPSAAVDLARKVFGSLERRSVLVLGTGEMGRLTLRCLLSERPERVYVASRHPARAERVGRALEGIPIERSAALERLGDVDVVITCTEAEAAFVSAPGLREARPGGAPLVILDIAVPRNVDPAAADLAGVFLYNVDDLQRAVDRTRDARAAERERAETIADRHASKYWHWYRARAAAPVIRRLRETAFDLVAEAREAAAGPGPRDADREEAGRLAVRAALNKILHAPTLAMRRLAERSDAEACLEEVDAALDAGGRGRSRIAEAEAG